MFGQKSRCLGIDIGEKTLKIAQLRRLGDKTQVSGWGLLAKDRPNLNKDRWRTEMFEDISLVLQVNGIRGGNASIALPDTLVNTSYSKIPPMPKEEQMNALKWEAGKDSRIPVEDMILDYISLGQVVEGSDTLDTCLVAVTRESAVRELCRRLKGMKINVRSVEFSTMAQISCFLRSDESSGITALVDLGELQTSLIVLNEGQVRFFRTINMGGKYISDMISQATGLNWWEAEKLKETGVGTDPGADEELSRALRGSLESIIDEVFHTFHFYVAERKEGAVERAVITGGGSLMPGISGFFQEILGIPVRVLDPFQVCIPSDSLRDREKLIRKGPQMVTAFGLAMTE